MIFILTTKDEHFIKEKFGVENYKFFDIDKLKEEFHEKHPDLNLKYENILINQYVIKRIRNGLKSFKSSFFFYRITEMDKRIVNNIKEYVMENHGHKIKYFTAVVEDELDKDIENLFDTIHTTNLDI